MQTIKNRFWLQKKNHVILTFFVGNDVWQVFDKDLQAMASTSATAACALVRFT